jgi:hypothetical protein
MKKTLNQSQKKLWNAFLKSRKLMKDDIEKYRTACVEAREISAQIARNKTEIERLQSIKDNYNSIVVVFIQDSTPVPANTLDNLASLDRQIKSFRRHEASFEKKLNHEKATAEFYVSIWEAQLETWYSVFDAAGMEPGSFNDFAQPFSYYRHRDDLVSGSPAWLHYSKKTNPKSKGQVKP